MSDIFYWPAFIGIVGALALTVILVTLLLLFKEQAIRVASLIFLSGLISMGAAYFACAAYFLLTEWNGPIAQKLLANGLIALGIPSAALAAFTLVVALPAVAQEPLQFEAFTVKIKGPTIQIVLWVVCFICIVGAIKWFTPTGPSSVQRNDGTAMQSQ